MVNKRIFKNARISVPVADTVNEAGGVAYKMEDREALAQYAVTGVFNGTYYTTAETQFDKVKGLVDRINDPVFVGKLAVYARKSGFMKDMPAFLVAWLASQRNDQATDVLRRVFPVVIDNGKMLRNFVQIIRSGELGRKSLGSAPKRLIQKWFASRDANRIFKDSIGNDPSMSDVIKLSHPRPKTKEHEALFCYLLDKMNLREDLNRSLPRLIKEYEAFKRDTSLDVPEIPFQFIASLGIPESKWKEIARNGGWHMVRMNLNTFARHGVFNDREMVKYVADKLRDSEEIERARVFPYQLFAAFKNARNIPTEISLALQDAMEIATKNVPSFGENVYVLPDVSGSMRSPVTGYRYGATTAVQCLDVAALVSASVLRTTPMAKVLPFAEDVRNIKLNPRDSVMTNAKKLSKVPSGATNCSAPLNRILKNGWDVDTVIFVSDNQSWIGSPSFPYGNHVTLVAEAWSKIKRHNKNAKLVCIDITPYDSVQTKNSDSVLNIGGFSDNVFKVIDAFVNGSARSWIEEIDRIDV